MLSRRGRLWALVPVFHMQPLGMLADCWPAVYLQLGVKLRRYLHRAAQQAVQAAAGHYGGGASSSSVGQQEKELEAVLAALDALGAAGVRSVAQEEAAAIDRKLKACRSPGLLAAERQRKQAAKSEKAAAKAARRAQERAAKEAELGILPVAAAPSAPAAAAEPSGEPAAKRKKPS